MIQIFSAGRTGRDGTGPIKGSTRGPRGPKKVRDGSGTGIPSDPDYEWLLYTVLTQYNHELVNKLESKNLHFFSQNFCHDAGKCRALKSLEVKSKITQKLYSTTWHLKSAFK